MEAKDTLLTMEEVKAYLIHSGKMEIIRFNDLNQLERIIQAILERQAGIAFTAGEKKVAEWINEKIKQNNMPSLTEWQAKLKELGL